MDRLEYPSMPNRKPIAADEIDLDPATESRAMVRGHTHHDQ
jgi:hypothetical protein